MTDKWFNQLRCATQEALSMTIIRT